MPIGNSFPLCPVPSRSPDTRPAGMHAHATGAAARDRRETGQPFFRGWAANGNVRARLSAFAASHQGSSAAALSSSNATPAGPRLREGDGSSTPSALSSTQSPFHDVLLNCIHGTVSPEERNDVRDLLRELENHPRGNAILRALRVQHEWFGDTPKIMIRRQAHPSQPRPSLVSSRKDDPWHLDLQALRAASIESAVDELAAVYNSMTNLLRSRDPGNVPPGERQLDAQLEAKWATWASDPSVKEELQSKRQRVVGWMRKQLEEQRRYGGMTRDDFKGIIKNETRGEIPGLSITIQPGRSDAVPPLPEDLYRLEISGNTIKDWSNLPKNLKILRAARTGGNSVLNHLPGTLTDLDITGALRMENLDGAMLPRRLRGLSAGNNYLTRVSNLPDTLRVLILDENRLKSLPDPLPPGLTHLSARDNQLRRLPDGLPGNLQLLDVQSNLLRRLPTTIGRLITCRIGLEGNPIAVDNIPDFTPGQGPRIHFSMANAPHDSGRRSETMAQAVQQWLGDQEPEEEVIIRWEKIDRVFGSRAKPGAGIAADDIHATGAFSHFLDRLRQTVCYTNMEFRPSVNEWLAELSAPGRRPLLEHTLQACVAATEQCNDRVSLTLNKLWGLRQHDDIRQGLYNGRPGEALDVMRQLYRARVLEDIAWRGIKTAARVDDVEVYLGYAVQLREPLALGKVVPGMEYYALSDLTPAHHKAALNEVLDTERAEFYKELVLDDTWRTLIARERPEQFTAAKKRLEALTDELLMKKVDAELARLRLDYNDHDAYNDLARTIWRDMEYEVLEPITREYLESAGVALPATTSTRH